MTICRACSGELTDRDRYCRNCGALVPPVVAELDETHRFNPSAPLPAGAHAPPDTTNPLYAPQYPVYSPPQVAAPMYQTRSLVRRIFSAKLFWALMMLALLFIFFGVGVMIGSDFARNDGGDGGGVTAVEDEGPEAARYKYEEAVQNALGFKQGEYSAAEFPDVQGIFVNNLMRDDSPAALARIQAGDLITELNGQPVRNDSELSTIMKSLETGQEVSVKVYRDGAVIPLRIKVSDPSFPPAQPVIDPEDQGFLGILDSSRHCCIPGTKKWGVKVEELHINGPAELFGLQKGDFITEFNGRPVKTPNEFNRHIRAANPRSEVLLRFYRGAEELKIKVIMGHRWKSESE
jgi:membrane-associated protease RseP (regulator of RpoE activity)